MRFLKHREHSNHVKGFKVFNPDWTCMGFQYEVGKVYEEDVIPSVCDSVFTSANRQRIVSTIISLTQTTRLQKSLPWVILQKKVTSVAPTSSRLKEKSPGKKF